MKFGRVVSEISERDQLLIVSCALEAKSAIYDCLVTRPFVRTAELSFTGFYLSKANLRDAPTLTGEIVINICASFISRS